MTAFAEKRPPVAAPILLLLLGVIAGCAGTPPTPDMSGEPELETPVIAEMAPQGPAELPESAWQAEFSAAERRLAAQDWIGAEQALQPLPDTLVANDLARHHYLLARAAYLRGDYNTVRALLESLPQEPVALALRQLLDNFRRHMHSLAGQYRDSARLGVTQLEYALDPILRDTLKRDIWHNLQRLPATELDSALAEATAAEWRAWLRLARLAADQPGVNALRASLETWLAKHPDHVAAEQLPGGLGFLLAERQPVRKVTLLLPLSGRLAPAARAVRDGYLAHYYSAREREDSDHEISIVDTGLFASAVAAYEHAVASGADLIIGPLSKEAVTQLGRHPQRPVPILALNRIDEPVVHGSAALVQLSLAPEDEARRIAELAFGQGARRALILRPAGERGTRLNDVLRQRWQALGGSIAASATYSSPEAYSASIKTALNLTDSEQRAREVRSMLATNIEFIARRRQDVDVVFLLAGTPAEARSVKPLLAFHYAGTLPVYATSSIYSGIPDPRNRDLNGARLVELPWLLGANPDLREALAAGETGGDSFTRLNALGADAGLLQSRCVQLQAGADALIKGATGLLLLDQDLRIIREPALATFDGSDLTRL
ncbi:penicillin-binding protein activator [Kineobactrum sediminis]|nr:penicillin-binding protein activator [Kineobactrum sediminis]